MASFYHDWGDREGEDSVFDKEKSKVIVLSECRELVLVPIGSDYFVLSKSLGLQRLDLLTLRPFRAECVPSPSAMEVPWFLHPYPLPFQHRLPTQGPTLLPLETLDGDHPHLLRSRPQRLFAYRFLCSGSLFFSSDFCLVLRFQPKPFEKARDRLLQEMNDFYLGRGDGEIEDFDETQGQVHFYL
jgi:hypothetical protein